MTLWVDGQGDKEVKSRQSLLATVVVGMAVMASAASQGNAGTSPFDPV